MLQEYIKALLLIFAAEMGDKTQIIAMTFATQYKIRDVLLGVIIGVFFNHGIAIILGRALSNIIPMNFIQILASLMFLFFGIMSLKDEEDDEEDTKRSYGPIFTVALAFFLGELGDKTQLTAMSLSTEASFPFVILLGTISGMVLTSSMGIFVGSKIGDKIPEVAIKIVSSIVFVLFGSIKLYTSLELEFIPIGLIMFISIAILEIYLINKFIGRRKDKDYYPLKEAAENLYRETEGIKDSLDSLCLHCENCSGKSCLIGFTRGILNEAREKGEYYTESRFDVEDFVFKNYNRDSLINALNLVISDTKKYNWDINEKFVVNDIRKALEIYIFKREIKANNIDEYIKKLNRIDDNIIEDEI